MYIAKNPEKWSNRVNWRFPFVCIAVLRDESEHLSDQCMTYSIIIDGQLLNDVMFSPSSVDEIEL